METKPAIYPQLLGMDRRWGVDPRFATEIRDMRWNVGRMAWESAGGSRRISLGTTQDEITFTSPWATTTAIQSMHFFTQHNGARAWLIYEDSAGNLYQFNPSTAARSASPGDVARDRANNALTDRAVVTAPWQRSQSAAWGDYLYLINGINRPLVFDGYVWDYAGFSTPAGQPSVTVMDSPHATTMSGTKLTSIGLGPTSGTAGSNYKCGYRWRSSCVNARGQESPLSEPSSMVTFTNTGGTGVTDGAHFALVNVPLGGAETAARKLYRTQNIFDSSGNPVPGYAEQFFYHSTIPDNVTTLVMDGLLDSNLVALVEPLSFGPWPLNGKYLCAFRSTMFVAGDATSRVYFSYPNHPERFPLNNVIDIGDAHLGPITGLYPLRNAVIVFKAYGIYLIKGNPVDGFHAERLTRSVGCVAPNTIKEVPGTGLVFLSKLGVYALPPTAEGDGTPAQPIPLHPPVKDYIDRLNASALIGACAAVSHRDQEYWLCVPEIGQDNNNLVLAYHYDIRQWSYRRDFPISVILETTDHRSHLIYGSWDIATAASRGIFVYSVGFPDKNGVAIAPLYRTGWMDAGGGNWRALMPLGILVRAGLHGNNTLSLDIHSNRKNEAWPAAAAVQQQYKEDEVPVYGGAVYDGAATWQALRPGPVRFDIQAPKQAMVHEVRASFTPQSGRRWMTLQAVALETAPDDPKNKATTYQERGGR